MGGFTEKTAGMVKTALNGLPSGQQGSGSGMSPGQQKVAEQGRAALQSGQSNNGSNFRSQYGPTGPASVQEQLASVLSKDNDLNQLARTQAMQQANQRGLLNSSMAIGAAQDAVTKNALPIASQDAAHQQGLEQDNQAHMQTLDRMRAESITNAWGVMAKNMGAQAETATQAINNIQNNPEIDAGTKTKMISQVIGMRDADLEFQRSLYDNFGNYLMNADIFPSL